MSEICWVTQCGRPASRTGLCQSHYKQKLRGEDFKPIRPMPGPRPNDGICVFDGCYRKQNGQGLCSGHQWQQANLSQMRPIRERSEGWGEWYLDTRGYVVRGRTNADTGRREEQRQHRVVMEEHVGRPLMPEETVHHLNGVRNQNNIENLELWSTSQPYGQRVIDKVAWAKEILRTYEPSSLST